MRSIFALAVVALGALATEAALADGLVYQLPEDGSWVRYELEGCRPASSGNAKQEIGMRGNVTISSVGVVEVDNEPCRWIEVVVDAKQDGRIYRNR